jgi:nucleotidyltransferase/DNA polymerase involved in DNA repair
MRQYIIALVDCDSFYVSCERKDNPDLQGKPVCVMTGGGNKGIIVSRSKEAKALGIKMGAPYFQIKDVYKEAICIPARMNRYSEISKEVMDTIKTFSPDVEVVSVDEAYIDLTSLNKVYNSTYTDIIKNIRQTILEKVGIPVSIGLSCSKTLAKLASDKAKSNNGIFVIRPDKIMDIVGEVPIEDVCGIGRKNNEHMKFHGIFTIKDFVAKDNAWIRKAFGINGLNLKSELTGIATSLVNSEETAPQSIQDTRSFEDFTQSLEYLQHELNNHVHTACQKLRRWNGFCQSIEVILKTKDFNYFATETKFANPTNSDREVRDASIKLLKSIYRSNLIYRATGITLKNLTYGKQIQQSLFETLIPNDDKLSHLVDELEAKYGQGIIKSG